MRPSEVSETYTETVSPPRSWQPVRRAEDLHARLSSAEARVSELEHVNNAFRRGTERIAAAGNIDAILDSFLLETMHLSGAASGAIADRIAGNGVCAALARARRRYRTSRHLLDRVAVSADYCTGPRGSYGAGRRRRSVQRIC